MNVSLTPKLEEFVRKTVQSGRYQTASEVVREGLRLLEEQDRRKAFSFKSQEELEEKLTEGIVFERLGKAETSGQGCGEENESRPKQMTYSTSLAV